MRTRQRYTRAGNRQRRRSSSLRQRFRPQIEVLEARRLLAAELESAIPPPEAEIDGDIVLTSNFASGFDEHIQAFRILNATVAPFDVGYYRSLDDAFDAGDVLLGMASVTDPDDLMVDGSRFVTAEIGLGAVEFPGVVGDDPLEDYFILTVADDADVVPEFDADPFNEDNASALRGVYHLPAGPVLAHGSAGGETIAATVVGDTLELAYGGTFTYDLLDVTLVRIRTHDGDDTVTGSELTEVVFGGDGSDDLSGEGGDDMLFGGPGKDRLDGGEGADTLDGGDGPDALFGGPGPDTVFDGPGDDEVDVGEGDDTLFATPGSRDVFTDTGGEDTLDFSLASLPITIDLDSTALQTVDSAGNTIRLIGQWENYVGTPMDDDSTVYAKPLDVPRTIDGGAGVDRLIIDALDNTVVNNGTTLSFPGTSLADITYVNFEDVRVLNAAKEIRDDAGPAEHFSAPGFVCIDLQDPPCDSAPQQGFNDTLLVSPANDGNIATWTFDGIAPGGYAVSTTWTGGEDRASSAPFIIRDGGTEGTIVAEVTVNQELEPGEFEDEGALWSTLGLVNVTGNTLTVQLTDRGADATANDPNEFVIADAVRIEPVLTADGNLPAILDDTPNQMPSGGVAPATLREASGPSLLTINATILAFRADLGGVDNLDLAPRSTGTRTAAWDEVNDLGASPESLPLDLYNTTFPRGLQLHTSGDSIQVSKSTVAGPRFSNLNSTYLTSFDTASPTRLMTPIGDNIVEVSFFVPGTSTPASVRGFGAVFTDVDNPFTTRMEFFDASGQRLTSRFVPAISADGTLSFSGVTFDEALIARVRITLGDGALLAADSPDDVTQPAGEVDVVVVDDFIWGEPVALPDPVSNTGFTSDCSAINGPGFLSDEHTCHGGQQAMFDFSALPPVMPGTYVVSTTWNAKPLASDTVEYAIDNGTEQVAASRNQQLPPDDFADAGIAWEQLAKVDIVDGQSPVITVSDPQGGFFVVDAIRLDLTPTIAVVVNDSNVLSGDSLALPDTAINIDTGVAVRTGRITLFNEARVALTVANFSASGQGFSIDSSETARQIPAGGSTQVDVRFSADTLGSFPGQVTFETNDFDNPIFVLDLSVDVVVDTTPPVITIDSPVNGARFIDGTTFSLTGTAPDCISLDETCTVTIADQTVLVRPDGSYRIDNIPAEFGNNVLVVIGTDLAGNSSQQNLTLDIVEDLAPTVQFERPLDGQGVVQGATIPLVVDAEDDVQIVSVELRVNGVAQQTLFVEPYVANVTIPNAVGDHELEACATDTGGNVTCKQVTVTAFASPLNDFNDIAVGLDGAPELRIFRPDGSERLRFNPYPGFAGGVRVAVGDVNSDGTPDIITGAGAGGGPHVKVFDGVTGSTLHSFFAYERTFTGGIFVASGDVTGDGFDDIITGAGSGGSPQVKVFDGQTGALFANFFAFDPLFLGGVYVASGDVNGDAQADIITGAGTGGGPHVRVFDGHTASQLPPAGSIDEVIADFFAFDSSLFTGGVFVAGGDVNSDGLDDIVVGADVGGSSDGGHVKVIDATLLPGLGIATHIPDPDLLLNFFAYDPGFTGGVRVAAGDVNGDGFADIVTGAGPVTGSAGAEVRVFDGTNGNDVGFAAGEAFVGPVVASADAPIATVVDFRGLENPNRFIDHDNGDVIVRDEDGNELLRTPVDDPNIIRINGSPDRNDVSVIRTIGQSMPKIIEDGGTGGDDEIRFGPNATGGQPIGYLKYTSHSQLVTTTTTNPNGNFQDFVVRAVDFERIHDLLEVIDREFDFPGGGNDVINFDTGDDANDDLWSLIGNNSGQIQFLRPSGQTEITLGDGADQFRTDLPTDQFPRLDGQDGEDVLVLTGTGRHLDLTDPSQSELLNFERIDIIGASENELSINGQSVLDATDTDDTLIVIHDDDDTVNYVGDGWQVETPIFVDGGQRHVLSNGDARVETINTFPFQNPLEPTDVNFVDGTTILDALQIINFIGRFDGVAAVDLPAPSSESELPERYYDVNGSRTATALDALNVINFVGRLSLGGGEEEGEAATVAAPVALPSTPSLAPRRTGLRDIESIESLQISKDTLLRELAWNVSGNAGANALDAALDAAALAFAEATSDDDSSSDDANWDQALSSLFPQADLP